MIVVVRSVDGDHDADPSGGGTQSIPPGPSWAQPTTPILIVTMADRLPFSWIEREQRARADDLLSGALFGVNEATEALARTMAPLNSPSIDPQSPSPEYWIKTVVLNMAAIGLRSARAAAILVEHGYAPESLAHARTLLEAVVQIRSVLANPEGDRARNLLVDEHRQRTTPSGVARRMGANAEFDLLSRRVHVTPHAMRALHQDPDETARIPITVVPFHDVAQSASILFAIQGRLLELAALLAEAWELEGEDKSLAQIRLVRRIDQTRHTPMEQLIASRPNPFRDPAGLAGSYI